MDNKKLHEGIREDLLEKILNNTYKLHEKIPKELDLAEQYGVSRPTVRQAIQSLVNEGYLERIKRSGTFVRQKKINQEFTHMIRSYDDEIQRKGLHPVTKVISFTKENASQDVAYNLNITENDKVFKLTRLRYARNEPVVLVTTYLPYKGLEELENVDFNDVSLYKELEARGYPVISIQRKLEVIKADELSGVMLNIPVNDPVFYFHSVGSTVNSTPVEYSVSWYRGDLNSFVFNINIM
jgi:possible transcriptional regulator